MKTTKSDKPTKPVEAYGVKGLKSTPWCKVFRNVDALNAWVEKNDAVVYGISK